MSLTMERVAELAETWCTRASAAELFNTRVEGSAESVVHEMCHAVVFGIDLRDRETEMYVTPINTSGSKLMDLIGARFDCIREDWVSDQAECRALAVEQAVYWKLGWDAPWKAIVDTASRDMRSARGVLYLDEMLAEAVHELKVVERAYTVIAWLEHFVKKNEEG